MTQPTTPHVQHLISGYIDGELTQQDSQRVKVHCDTCDQCAEELASLLELRKMVKTSDFDAHPAQHWHENIKDEPVNLIRTSGWLMILIGVIAAAGTGLYFIFKGFETFSVIEVLVVGGIYGGLFLLLVSVIRQRLIERKTDKYKDVEI